MEDQKKAFESAMTAMILAWHNNVISCLHHLTAPHDSRILWAHFIPKVHVLSVELSVGECGLKPAEAHLPSVMNTQISDLHVLTNQNEQVVFQMYKILWWLSSAKQRRYTEIDSFLHSPCEEIVYFKIMCTASCLCFTLSPVLHFTSASLGSLFSTLCSSDKSWF